MPAPVVLDVQLWQGQNSLSQNITFSSGTSRAWVVFVLHFDEFSPSRGSVSATYDNSSLTPGRAGSHVFENEGSFQWDTVMADVFVANEAFIAAQTQNRNLTVQNIGPDAIVVLVELDNVEASPVDVTGDSGINPGTSIDTDVTTTRAGVVNMSQAWTSSVKAVQQVLAMLGDDGTNTIVLDGLATEDVGTLTPGAGQTAASGLPDLFSQNTFQAHVTYEVVAGGGTGPQSANASPATVTAAAPSASASVPGGSTGGEILRLSESGAGQIPTTAWTAVSFDTEEENDAAVYNHAVNTEIEFLEAGTYKLTAHLAYQDTSNGRANYQARAVSTSGVVLAESTSYDTGYNRDTSEPFASAKVAALFVEVAAGAKVEVQHRRDTDTPTGGLLAGASSVEVVRINPTAIGIYEAATVGQAYGGTTENQVVLDSTVYESDTAAIERSGNTIACKTQGKRYLSIGSVWGNTGGSRTQRNFGLNQTGASALPGRVIGNAYQRNAANENAGFLGVDVGVRDGADLVWDMSCWRGDGVANDEGGADVNGSWVTEGAMMIVLELPDGMDVWRSHDSTGLVPLDGAFTTHNVRRDVDIADAGSFSSGTGLGEIDVAHTGHVWGFFNLWGANDNVGSGARLTSFGQLLIAGVVQLLWAYHAYMRGNQSTQDTHGIALLIGGLFPVTAGDTLSVRSSTVAGGEAGSARTQANTSVAILLNPAGWAVGGGSPPQSADADAANVGVLSIAASVVVGGVLVGADPAGSAMVAPSAAVVPGAVLVDADAAAASWSTPSASVQILTLVDADPATATWAAPAATVIPGGVSAPATPATAAWVAPSASVIPGAVSVGADPATATWAAPAAAVIPGAVSVGAGLATAAWSTPDASVTQGSPGGLTAFATPATASWSTPNASVIVGPVSADAVAATVTTSAPAASAEPGPVLVDADVAVAAWVSIAAQANTPAVGLVANATPATVGIAARAANVIPGSVLVDAGVATSSWSAGPAAVIPGGVLVDADVAASSWAAPSAQAVPGEVLVDAIPASAVWRSIDGEPFVFVPDGEVLLELPAPEVLLLELELETEALELAAPDATLLELDASKVLLELAAPDLTLLELDWE